MNKLLKYGLLGVVLLLIVNAGLVVYDIRQDLKSSVSSLRDETNIRLNYLDRITTRDVSPDYIIKSSVIVSGILGTGSGTVIAKTEDSMYILTCYHVIDDIIEMNNAGLVLGATVGYTIIDDNGVDRGMVMYGADIIKSDKENDLALLKIRVVDKELNVVKIANKTPQKGDVVYSVGNPLGAIRTISRGLLSNKIDGFYISDNTTTYGNSGGGLFNVKGELIGVPSNVMTYPTGITKEGEDTYAPESSLGISINLLRIKAFLKYTEIDKDWTDVVAEGTTDILKDLQKIK